MKFPNFQNYFFLNEDFDDGLKIYVEGSFKSNTWEFFFSF